MHYFFVGLFSMQILEREVCGSNRDVLFLPAKKFLLTWLEDVKVEYVAPLCNQRPTSDVTDFSTDPSGLLHVF